MTTNSQRDLFYQVVSTYRSPVQPIFSQMSEILKSPIPIELMKLISQSAKISNTFYSVSDASCLKNSAEIMKFYNLAVISIPSEQTLEVCHAALQSLSQMDFSSKIVGSTKDRDVCISPDVREGVSATLEKAKPIFSEETNQKIQENIEPCLKEHEPWSRDSIIGLISIIIAVVSVVAQFLPSESDTRMGQLAQQNDTLIKQNQVQIELLQQENELQEKIKYLLEELIATVNDDTEDSNQSLERISDEVETVSE